MVSKKQKEKNASKEQITKSIRDLASMKITLPLGNPALKLVHTNQFLWTELPKNFVLSNFGVLSKALASTYSRGTSYVKNRWYIEEVTIDNDGKNCKMELNVNPFASSYHDFKDMNKSFKQAYNDAQQKTTTTTTTTNKTVNSKLESNFKGGEGKTINNLAKSIVGDEKNILKKAKKIHTWGMNHISYKYYKNSKYGNAENCYKHRSHINCADTSILISAINRASGVPCYIVHSTNHYYVVIEYDNKLYCSDPTSKQREFNRYWTPSQRYKKFTGKSCYNRKCNKKPC